MAAATDYSSQPVNSTRNPTVPTYSNKVKQPNQQSNFPKKDQAITMNATENATTKDYVLATGEIIKPINIIFASKIANNRICIYLKNEELVDELIQFHPKIKINNNNIEIRRYITPAQRIIISNLCPSIPHNTIETAMKSYGLKLVSPINFFRVGMQEEGYNHILSFRRQVYITKNADSTVPNSLLIEDAETSYRIFLTEDIIYCPTLNLPRLHTQYPSCKNRRK